MSSRCRNSAGTLRAVATAIEHTPFRSVLAECLFGRICLADRADGCQSFDANFRCELLRIDRSRNPLCQLRREAERYALLQGFHGGIDKCLARLCIAIDFDGGRARWPHQSAVALEAETQRYLGLLEPIRRRPAGLQRGANLVHAVERRGVCRPGGRGQRYAGPAKILRHAHIADPPHLIASSQQ